MNAPTTQWPLLLLLPGMDGSGVMFEPLIQALGSEVVTQVVRYPAALTSYPGCTHFVQAQLPRDRPFVLLGESFSGPVAIALAAEQPRGLVGLVLCSTFVRNPHPGLAWLAPLLALLPARRLPLRLIQFLLLGRWATEPLMNRVKPMMEGVPAATMKARLLSVVAVDDTALLGHIQVPVLALCASHDRVVPNTAAKWISAHLPALEIVILNGPHWLLQARPAAATQALKAFLDRLPREQESDSAFRFS